MSDAKAKPKPEAAAEPDKVPVQPLHPQRKILAEQARNAWRVVPADGVKLEDMLAPGYWAHVAKDLQIGDKIEAVSEDNSQYAELLVRDVSHTGARVAVLMVKTFEGDDLPVGASGLVPQFNNALQWTVVRAKDRKRMAENLPNREAAQRWIADNPGAV